MYPVMLNVKGKKCVVIGGGSVALRKAAKLRSRGAEVIAVSPEFFGNFDGIEKIKKRYEPSDIAGSFLVIAATDDKDLNLEIASDAKKQNILVSLADNAEISDFVSPASHDIGDITLAVSTNGKFPALSKKLCDIMSEDIGFYNDILPTLEKYREKIIAEHGDSKQEIISYMVSDEMLDTARRDLPLFEQKIKEKI